VEAVIRLLPYADADGATNMAADETLARSAAQGIASLRCYGWTAATLSLGYFQPCAVRLADPQLALLPWVRRPSGGATLVHHHELTYALALPQSYLRFAGSPLQAGQPWLPRMHRVIAAALAELGLAEQIESVQEMPIRRRDTFACASGLWPYKPEAKAKQTQVLCFEQFTSGDLLCAGRKIAGSAQRKYRQALMQHGSILLERSEYTLTLWGIRESAGVALPLSQLLDAILASFAENTGWRMEIDDWTVQEKAYIEELVLGKYVTAAWNEKR
jgi:lipoate-protein ligase A